MQLRTVGPPLAVAFLVSSGVCFAQFRAGAAKRVVTPDLAQGTVYMAGFGQNRVATRVHDDLFARCIALAAGAPGRPLVLCGVDSIGLFLEDVRKIREAAALRLRGPADIVVAALHDHEAPDTMGLWGPAEGKSGLNERYNRFVIERTAEAAAEAVNNMQPAAARFATVRAVELDGFIDDTRPPVVHDSELIALRAEDKAGRTIATLVNWANHPETLGSKNTEITADYCGYFYRELEKRLGGTAVLLNGAVGGMQSPLGAKVVVNGAELADGTFGKAEHIGTRVAAVAAAAVGGSKPVELRKVEYKEASLTIPVANQGYLLAAKAGLFQGRKPMGSDNTTQTVVGLFRLSGAKPVLEGALIPGELYPELSVGGVERYAGADFPDAPIERPIKKAMTAPYRMLVGLANDEIGYIIPKAEWDETPPWLQNAPRRWYGEVNSTGPEAAPLIVAAVEKLLR